MVRHIKKAYSKDGNLTDKEKSIAYATAWKQHNKEEVERHGVKKDASKSELKKIRSSSKSSKGAKQLAHWKLNMHHNKEETTFRPKMLGPNTEYTPHAKDVVKVDKDKLKATKSIKKDLDKVHEAVATAEGSLKNWKHQDAVKVAGFMIREYGQPDEVTETMLKWYKLGDFGKGEKETWIIDESIPHSFPAPHHDFLYTSKEIVVPAEMMDTLGHVTGSIIIDGLKKTVTARCGSLNANASTLGFVDDLVKGKVPNDFAKAKKEYAKRIKTGAFLPGYKDRLDKYYKEEEKQKQVKKLKEDARYKAAMGPGAMEWGTDIGDDYYRSLTPGQEPKRRDLKGKNTTIKPVKTPFNEGVIGGTIGAAIGGSVGGVSGAVTGAKVGSTVGDAAAIGAGAYGAYKVGKGAVKAGKAVGKGVKKVKDKIKGKKEVKEEMSSAEKSKHEYPINNEKETFDKGDKDHWLTGQDGEWYIEQIDVIELEREVENYTFDDAIEDGLYDEDELTMDDFDNTPGFENEIQVTEALSVQGRLKRRFNARRNKQKLKVARRIALRRGSTPDRLKRRATRGARLMVYKRLLRGRDRAGLPPAEKARLERMIQRFQPLVSRISVKLLPQMRKNEIKRLVGRGKIRAKTSRKFKPAKAVKSASQKRTKKFKIPKGKYKAPKKKAVKPRYASGGPTLKKASKAYKAFSYSVG